MFCAFRSDLRSDKSYAMDDEQILARGQEAVENGCTEMHLVGGLHHQRKYEWYRDMVSLLHDAYPQIHLKAYPSQMLSTIQPTKATLSNECSARSVAATRNPSTRNPVIAIASRLHRMAASIGRARGV